MTELTGVERIGNILQRKPVDRIGLLEHFWGDTLRLWQKQGKQIEAHALLHGAIRKRAGIVRFSSSTF